MVNNPCGISGFEFIEFSTPEPSLLRNLFKMLGFSKLKQHRSKKIEYYNQNDIHFLLNFEPASFAAEFAQLHGPSASSTAWRVSDAKKAFKEACNRGAKQADTKDYDLPAVKGVGDSLIYFVEAAKDTKRWEKMGFDDIPEPEIVPKKGFALVDHLTNNVYKGRLLPLAQFYKDVFGFEEIRYFDIRGEMTGLKSYALRSPCGSFCIPINEGTEAKSQINEYLDIYKGEGIQHIALLTADIITVMEKMRSEGLKTLDIDADYYEMAFQRVPQLKEDKKKIKDFNLLVDGDSSGYLVQIFTENLVGPIFFEFIQRQNNLGFGEGNFGALFRAIERDQQRRGVLS